MINTLVATNPTVGYIDSLALDALRAAMPGRVYTPTDDGYDAARACFSLADQPSPAVVVTAAHSEDVIAAVRFARSQRLPIGVRATGHNPAFPYQGGLMINTEAMQGVTINPVTQTARVEAGVVWGAVVRAAHAYGLAPLNGSAPHVGVVGYSLFGGFGWLLRKYGAAVDSVVSADIVTADGVLRHVSQENDPELFWALRGASGNFGVVTALEFKLYPVSEVYGGAMFFPLERADKVLTTYSEWVKTLPEEFTSAVVLMRMPPLPELPEFLRGKAVITVRGAFVGTADDGADLLKPLRMIDGLIVDTFRMMPYTETATIANDPTKPAPAWRTTMMLKELSAEAIDTLLRVDGVDAPTAVKVIEIRHLGGAMTRVDPHTTSFSQRYAPFILQTVDALMNPAQVEVAKRNTRAIFEALQPYSTGGVLPSWLGSGDYGVNRTRTGFLPEHYERLVALKDHYDPTNLFRLNHNIPPSIKK
jgi:FAD/FMN-containing dehydrogenase